MQKRLRLKKGLTGFIDPRKFSGVEAFLQYHVLETTPNDYLECILNDQAEAELFDNM